MHLHHRDVRVTRELAHRRFVWSIARQIVRFVSLHALDAIAIGGGALVAARVVGSQITSSSLPALIGFVLVGLNIRRSYKAGSARRDPERLITGVLIGVVLAALPSTIGAPTFFARWYALVFAAIAFGLLLVERLIVDALVHAAYARGIGLRRALVVAAAEDYQGVITGLALNEEGRTAEDQTLVGNVSIDDRADGNTLGTVNDLPDLLDRHDVSELIVGTSLSEETLSAVAEECFARGIRVLVIPPAALSRNMWGEATRIGHLPAYQLHPARLELPALIIKRATDLVLAALGLVVALPLMALIAIAIKLESRGPVFFRQRRVGLGGREFLMWKFRSMRNEAESHQPQVAHLNPYGDGRLFKLRDDPRVTRVGRLLRRFSLDELPQLLNVLNGDMSLVGPRPPLPKEVERYEPHHLVRLSVVPGLTGPWQVNGRNLITDFEQVVLLERDYIETWSLRLDIEIMLRTTVVVLSGKGAY